MVARTWQIWRWSRLAAGLVTSVVFVQPLSCARKRQPQVGTEPRATAAAASAVAPAPPPRANRSSDIRSASAARAEMPPASPVPSARVGAEAPDFELPDLNGKLVKLSSFRGKVVVLEWFNPGCLFVKSSHTKGSLVSTAARQQRGGVVWLAINSAGPGRPGYGVQANRVGVARFRLSHPVLLDESGKVGQMYDAQHTPHLYVIDQRGVLVYRGAIDNSPDAAEGESAPSGKLVNYVDAAVADLRAARLVATAETAAYGCSVRYGGPRIAPRRPDSDPL